MSQIDERLKALTPAQRALFDARLKEKGLTAPRSRSVQPIPGRERLPWFETSLDQERLWFIDQMEPGNPAYNIHSSSRLHGRIDPALMRRAVNASIARHEVLRTTFGVVDGRPVQIVAPFLEIDVPVLELGPVPPAEREKAGLAAAVEAATERFDLARGPLVRVRLGRLAEDDHVLMMCMHHAITDRFSFDIFEDEISRVYVALRDGTTAAIPPLPIQFADFAAWQREELSGERLERHLGHWRETMAGATLVLDVPGDRPRPAVQTFNGGRAYLVYPEGILVALKDLARRTSATMFMAVLAALDVLCYKHSGQRDFIIGSAIADRNRPETENAIGYFLNMLLLRARIDPAMTFRQLLVQTRERALGAFAHQDVPFATLVAELKPKQDPSRNPLIQVSYIYLDFPIVDTSAYAGLACSSIEVDNGAARFDLTLACTEGVGPGLHSYLEFNTDIYDRARVEGMLRQLGRVLEFAAVSPDLPIASLDILEPAERARTTVAFNDVARPHEPACLDELVERAARAHPDSPALVIGGQTISLARLRDGAESLARRLRAAGAGPGSLVGVAAERSVGQAVALLAVMKSGAAYVPLDLSLPPERLESMLGDARPVAILAQRRLLPSL
ncbi:MAG TPA: condensation domain-containing protein, partial [Verrucomicrobiae bacterium]|nr:condensation domain-containing protein [Verrucomicrobiae bacterium]